MAHPTVFKHVKTLMELWEGENDSTKLDLLQMHYGEMYDCFRKQEHFYTIAIRDLNTANDDRNNLLFELGQLDGIKHELFNNCSRIREESLSQVREEKRMSKIAVDQLQETINQMRNLLTKRDIENAQLIEKNREMDSFLKETREKLYLARERVERVCIDIDLSTEHSTAYCVDELRHALEVKINNPVESKIDTQARCKYGNYKEQGTRRKRRKIKKKVETKAYKPECDDKAIELEKDVIHWRSSCFTLIAKVYNLQLEVKEKASALELAERREQQLTKLCRQLQMERATYMKTQQELGNDQNELLALVNASKTISGNVFIPIVTNGNVGEPEKGKPQPKHGVNGGKNNKKSRKQKLRKQLQRNQNNQPQPTHPPIMRELTKEEQEEFDKAIALVQLMTPSPPFQFDNEATDMKPSTSTEKLKTATSAEESKPLTPTTTVESAKNKPTSIPKPVKSMAIFESSSSSDDDFRSDELPPISAAALEIKANKVISILMQELLENPAEIPPTPTAAVENKKNKIISLKGGEPLSKFSKSSPSSPDDDDDDDDVCCDAAASSSDELLSEAAGISNLEDLLTDSVEDIPYILNED